MKFLVMLCLLSTAAFAGSFTKVDEGEATWILSSRNKAGVVFLRPSFTGTDDVVLNTDQIKEVDTVL